MSELSSVAPASNGGIPVIQAERSPVYQCYDLKVFAAFESKLHRVLKETKGAMQDIDLHWNEKKCSVVHIWYKEGRDSHHHARLGKENNTNSWGC